MSMSVGQCILHICSDCKRMKKFIWNTKTKKKKNPETEPKVLLFHIDQMGVDINSLE